MKKSTAVVWLRNDQRLTANPALAAGCSHGKLLVVYIHEEPKNWKLGGASCWWLHHSLVSLSESLREKGSRLCILKGEAESILPKIAKSVNAESVYWNRRYEPELIRLDKRIQMLLEKQKFKITTFNGSLLAEPSDILKKDGSPYQVFTAYWKAGNRKISVPKSGRIKLPPSPEIKSTEISKLNLLPKISWDQEFYDCWQPGETAAKKLLRDFARNKISAYQTARDLPNESGTSQLSPYLHFGNLSVQQVWAAVLDHHGGLGIALRKSEQFLKELFWRNFAAQLLYHFPHTDRKPLKAEFNKFPWVNSKPKLRVWQRGLTGYPLVDAGMRQLWRTGWMHNRVRMVAASFLVKDLRVKWQLGADWFWDTLVDADLASNSLGWQWVAGCGADAAPYFRIFNPTTQSRRFDPDGKYIKRWVPELAKLDLKWIHEPWQAPKEALKKAGVEIGKNYPRPIVDHSQARIQALRAYDRLK